LSFALSADLYKAIDAAENDPAIRAVVFTGANGNFSGGADINDFLSRPAERPTTIRDVIARIERGTKIYVAAIDGNALGGGLELSLACDYRVATKRSKLGLPEIRLGLLPGAGGTQRLTRLIGAQPALELMLKGESIDAARAKELGILDEVVESDAVTAALTKTSGPKRRVSALKAELGIKGLSLFAVPFMVAQAHKMCPPEDKGGYAAHKLVDAVQAAIELDFPHGLAREFRLFDELVQSAPAQALIHLFFAERELSKIPDLPPAAPLEIKKAAVIGGGTMGTGIAITFANADIPVTVIEPVDEQVERAKQMIFGMFSHQVQRGRLTQEEAWKRGQSIVFEREFDALRDADIVIEAVFENMDVKKEVFAKLDAAAKPEAILASNTSTLDIDEMAAQTKRPEKVCGTHFFAPANIMKLLEIVRGKTASPQTIATAMKLSKTLRKVGVLSGNAFGFIGNRMIFDYAREALYLAGLGVAPARSDAVMKDFGMAMGPFAMFDLSGVDVFWRIQQERAGAFGPGTAVIDRLYEQKRWGQKTGAGFYTYEKGGREPIRDAAVEALFAEEAKKAGVAPRAVSDDEIVKRLVFALVNVGADLVRDGIALRPGDVDIVYIYGYGFPPHHGGPMWYADEVGVAQVVADMKAFGWEPSPVLTDLAKSGGKLANYRKAAEKELAHA
ncbi:MAG: enoyl-CoA hydratase/isomerase family protein, partial [Candidatus Eremiobacteraeota bacterium]|nr:enoyl-CoA hydratase/isomerase family protein [Candidatus Eremiobacteraeota bacterium]